jgi:hypothetical protein
MILKEYERAKEVLSRPLAKGMKVEYQSPKADDTQDSLKLSFCLMRARPARLERVI